jgi:hypothetical protein
MRRLSGVLGAGVAALAVAVPLGLADGGTGPGDGKAKTVVTCARTTFAGKITRVGTDAIGVRPGDSETGRVLVVGLDPETVIKRADVTADPTVLAPGVLARFLVRACKSGERRTLRARLILVQADRPAGTGDTKPTPSTEPKLTPPPTEPKPEEPKPPVETCGQGETDAQLVSLSAGSITVRTKSGEGVKEWPLTVNGDTLVRMNDQAVSLSVLKPGDYVHLVVVRCPTAGTVRALRIDFLAAGPSA